MTGKVDRWVCMSVGGCWIGVGCLVGRKEGWG